MGANDKLAATFHGAEALTSQQADPHTHRCIECDSTWPSPTAADACARRDVSEAADARAGRTYRDIEEW